MQAIPNEWADISLKPYEEIFKHMGGLFTSCRKAFERAVKRARIELSKGQCTHVLHHTFASHFMMDGRNRLVSRDILGHANIKMTMVYAHILPDHLEDIITKSQLTNLECKIK